MKRFTLTILLAALGICSGAAVARADAIGPPPDDCGPGTIGASCHGPPYCAPDLCPAEGCGAGRVCRTAVGLCTTTISCGGWGSSTPVNDARGMCNADGACPSGQVCQMFAVCLPDTPGIDAGTPPVDGGPAPRDAGGTAVDSGPAGLDSGLPSGTDGGRPPVHSRYGCSCRAVSGRGSFLGMGIGLAAWLLARHRRRHR